MAADKIVSPGVFTRENDLSYLPTGIAQIGAAIVGPTEYGPAFLPKIVTTQQEYEQVFGTPSDYYTGLAAQNYLKEAGTLTVVRVGGVGGYRLGGALVVEVASGSSKQIAAVLAPSASQAYGAVPFYAAQVLGSANFNLTSSAGTAIASASVLVPSTSSVDDVFGYSPFFGKSAYTYLYTDVTGVSGSALFGKTASQISCSFFYLDSYAGNTAAQDFTDDATFASTPWVQSQLFGGSRYNLFKVHTLGDGNTENTRFKVQISNVKASDGTLYGTFTLTLRAHDDTDRKKTILETYSGLDLDPASPNFIARRIGDRQTTIDSTGKITETGNFGNTSKYVRIEVATEGTYPLTAIPVGHAAYQLPINFGTSGSLLQAVTFTTASVSSSIYLSGIDYSNTYNTQVYLKPVPVGAGTGANVAFGLDSTAGIDVTDNSASGIQKKAFLVAFQGGFDGLNPTTPKYKGADIIATNTQGFNCSSATASGSVAYARAFDALSNPDEFDINLLATPGIIRQLHPVVTTDALDMCEAREDVFYIADLSAQTATIADVVNQADGVDSSYIGAYYPWIKTVDTNTNKVMTVPPSVLMPAVYAQSDRLGAEWFAPAGLNRGGIPGAIQVVNRLTHSERDTLYEGKVNPIAAFPGQGISAFGQKTLQDKASALDRINVRRLLINLKKFVASTSRFLVFEQNTAQTRQKFLNTVNPYLEAVQQRQGLYAFRVVMDETNNTPDVIDRNILVGAIYLQPTKTAEFIIIDFNVLPTGATFNV